MQCRHSAISNERKEKNTVLKEQKSILKSEKSAMLRTGCGSVCRREQWNSLLCALCTGLFTDIILQHRLWAICYPDIDSYIFYSRVVLITVQNVMYSDSRRTFATGECTLESRVFKRFKCPRREDHSTDEWLWCAANHALTMTDGLLMGIFVSCNKMQ